VSYTAGSFELDDNRPMSVGALRAIRIAALAAAFVVGMLAIPSGHAAGGKPTLRAPTLLWKAYPLVQRPRGGAVRRTASQTREASAAPSSDRSGTFENMLLMTALLAAFLAAGTVLFLRRPTTARAGGTVAGRDGVRTPRRPVRRPQPRRPRANREAPAPAAPPPLPDAPTKIAAPAVPEEQGTAPESRDTVQRLLDDLLEALQSNPHASAQQERTPELELRELIVRKYAAPAAARASIEQEIDAALARIEARRAAEARAVAVQRTSVARSEIRLSRGLVRSQLYAAICGSDEAFAGSAPFRLRAADLPGAQAQHALALLLAELEHAGWTVVAHGSTWYEHTLEFLPSDSTDAPRADEAALPRVIYKRVALERAPEEGGS